MRTQFVLTQKGNIASPVIYSNGFDFKSELDYQYSFEVLCDDNSTVNVHVFGDSSIPRGFYDSIQAVPLSLFMKHTSTEHGLKI